MFPCEIQVSNSSSLVREKKGFKSLCIYKVNCFDVSVWNSSIGTQLSLSNPGFLWLYCEDGELQIGLYFSSRRLCLSKPIRELEESRASSPRITS